MPAVVKPPLRQEGFVYPSVDPGIAVQTADAIVEGNAELMSRIKLAYGCDAATFERDIVRVVRSYASYVNLLPATADNYFAEPGGLFRLGLETAFYALQGTDAQIFEGRATISARRQLEPRWRLATFIAGLCNEVHRTLSHLTVRDAAGQLWPSYLVALTPWLEGQGAERLFPRWDPTPQESRASGVFALPLIVDRATMQYLATGNTVVVPHMMAAISGTALYREHNILDELVRRATAMVIDRNLRADTENYGKPTLGAHLERYLVDAMRRLAASSAQWQPNVTRTRVWFGRDGMFLVWPRAIQDVRELLEVERLPGMPRVPDTLLEILLDAKVLEARDGAHATWVIHPPESDVTLEAVRLTTPDVLIGSFAGTVARLDQVLHVDTDSPRPPAARPAGARQPDGLQRRPHAVAMRAPDDQPSLLDIPPPGPPPADSSRPARAAQPSRPRFTFTPSLRLRRNIAEPLGHIVDSLNDRDGHSARTVNTGVFIPLVELLRRNLDPVVVQRELDQAGMLVRGQGDERTHNHEFDGAEVPGIVLLPQYVKGLKPADFTAPEP